MDTNIQEIKNYWEDQARKNTDKEGNTLKDSNLRSLEIKTLESYIKDNTKVLDIGCGNGYTTSMLAGSKKIDITGVDYSDNMVSNAKKSAPHIKFEVKDVMDTGYPDNTFDIIITERCLINLNTWDNQAKAITEIHRILKKGGKFLMLEGSQDGMDKLNKVRSDLGLEKIEIVWHNLFFEDRKLESFTKNMFSLLETNNFCSTYMLISRALHPKIMEPRYDNEINEHALKLPNMGDYGYLKLYVFQKN